MSATKIQWTNLTWNPTTGCNKVSQGCKNCYAEVMHKRLAGMGQIKYAVPFSKGVQTHYKSLLEPLKWKKPCMVFVNSMSDLFHYDVPFEFIDMVFAVMAATPHITYQILTKRPDRMAAYFKRYSQLAETPRAHLKMVILNACDIVFNFEMDIWEIVNKRLENEWPLKNVWMGTSCENQKEADTRIPFLIQVPAAVRFLSCEPLIGPLVLRKKYINKINWVIVGGESGKGARPMHPNWAINLLRECMQANIPFFFKQWGEWAPAIESIGIECKKKIINSKGEFVEKTGWDNYLMAKMGKHRTGRLLMGQEFNEMPVTAPS